MPLGTITPPDLYPVGMTYWGRPATRGAAERVDGLGGMLHADGGVLGVALLAGVVHQGTRTRHRVARGAASRIGRRRWRTARRRRASEPRDLAAPVTPLELLEDRVQAGIFQGAPHGVLAQECKSPQILSTEDNVHEPPALWITCDHREAVMVGAGGHDAQARRPMHTDTCGAQRTSNSAMQRREFPWATTA